MQDAIINMEDNTQELAIFNIGEIVCGLDITELKEINKHIDVTIVHHAPEYVRGVLNLRGNIVTVIDLRKKFGYESIEMNNKMRIIIVKSKGENIGLLVDGVDDIVMTNHKDIEPPPSNVNGVTGTFFSGIYKMKSALVSILNIEEILKDDNSGVYQN